MSGFFFYYNNSTTNSNGSGTKPVGLINKRCFFAFPLLIINDSFSNPKEGIFISLNIISDISSFNDYLEQELNILRNDSNFILKEVQYNSEINKDQSVSSVRIETTTFDIMLSQKRELTYFYYHFESNVYVLLFNIPEGKSGKYERNIMLIAKSIKLKSIKALAQVTGLQNRSLL